MAALQPLLKKVLTTIKPKQSAIPKVEATIKKIEQLIKKSKLNAKVKKGGSYAKNTFLSDDHDIDLFVCFHTSHADQDLSSLLKKALAPLKPKKVHGSRDYFQLSVGPFKFELVPVLDIKKPADAKNVTDFSPLHVSWFKKKVGKLRDDVRLAKQFCKAQKVYGAESYIKGFSGHVIDILIIHYGGFIPFLKAITKWKKQTVIDTEKLHKHPLITLNASKITGPLVLVDPVQPLRNAAAALSFEKKELLANSAKAFLKSPQPPHFQKQELDLKKLKKEGAILLQITPTKGKSDIVGSKILKVFEHYKAKLAPFKITDSGWDWNKANKAIFWFQLKHHSLPSLENRTGPPLEKKSFVKEFKKKYKKTFIKNGIIYAEVKRKFTDPKKLLKHYISDKYTKERVKSCSLI